MYVRTRQKKKSLEFLDSSGYTVSRHSEHGVKRQQGLTPDDGTYMSKRASYVSEYAELAILEIRKIRWNF